MAIAADARCSDSQNRKGTELRRVVVFNHYAMPPGEAGGTRHVELFGRLPGWHATIIAANRGLLQHDRRVAPHPMFRHVWVYPSQHNGLRRILGWLSYLVTASIAGCRGPRPDLVYGSSPHLLAPVAAWLVARRWRVPFVLEVRDLWPKVLVDMGTMQERSPVYRVLLWLESFLYRRARLIVAMAEGAVQELESRADVRCSVTFVPNGADSADFTVGEHRETLRARFGFDRPTVVYAGAHGPANGLQFVLDAAAELRASHSNAEFVLVGDGTMKAELVQRANDAGLGNIRFLDPVPKSEVPALLAAADIGLHCLADVELFHYGVSPNKLFDYMAAGLPVITNTPGEVAGLVEQAAAGIACPPNGIAAAVVELVRVGAATRSDLGEAGRRYLETNRSRSALAHRLEAELDALVGERKAINEDQSGAAEPPRRRH